MYTERGRERERDDFSRERERDRERGMNFHVDRWIYECMEFVAFVQKKTTNTKKKKRKKKCTRDIKLGLLMHFYSCEISNDRRFEVY